MPAPLPPRAPRAALPLTPRPPPLASRLPPQAANALTYDELQSLTYLQVKGSGIANTCPVLSTGSTNLKVKRGPGGGGQGPQTVGHAPALAPGDAAEPASQQR